MHDDPCREESEEAFVEGDTRFPPGTAMSALAKPVFRTIYFGAFLSNIGTWMQQVALGALAFHLTESATFVGVLLFAQMGPFLVIGPIAGVIADSVDRKKLLIAVSVVQLASAAALSIVVRADDPSKVAIASAVLVGGIASSVFMPAYSAILPYLVGREDLAGAISLQSAQMNISRVIGPILGAGALPAFGFSGVFLGNAVSYVFVILALLRVRLPTIPDSDEPADAGWRRLTGGVRIARRERVVGRALVTITVFSSLCLLWVGQFPVFAAENLGVDEESQAYQVLYACFGLGAAVGSIAVGTVLARFDKARLVRVGLIAYAMVLTLYALLRDPAPAYVVVLVLGACYFGSVTALNTAMQSRLANHERGRVMALWMMGFGGAVSLANLVLSPLVDAVGMPPLMIAGAIIALGLAAYADVSPSADDAVLDAAVEPPTPATIAD